VELLKVSPELKRVVNGSSRLDQSLAAGISVRKRGLVLLLSGRNSGLSCLLLSLLRLLGGLLPLSLILWCCLSVAVKSMQLTELLNSHAGVVRHFDVDVNGRKSSLEEGRVRAELVLVLDKAGTVSDAFLFVASQLTRHRR
jgi:hypothetical protein